MIELLKHQRGLAARPADFDADPCLLNCTNGTLDLRTFDLRLHRREDMLTKMTACAYEPEATSAMWERHLREASRTRRRSTRGKRFAGYSLTGSTEEERFLFARPGGGKTTTRSAHEDLGRLRHHHWVRHAAGAPPRPGGPATTSRRCTARAS
jgi:putative DNA primase/helicase